MIQRLNESQHVTSGSVVHVAAWFVGFGFQSEFQIVFLIQSILAQKVHRFARTLDSCDGVLGCIGFRPFAASPEDINLCTEFNAQIDGVHRFLQSIRAHFRIISGKCTILENRVCEQVGGRHRDD